MKRQERRLIEKHRVIPEALDLAVGESRYSYCPFCEASHENKLSVSRTEEGLLYNCYRGSCGARGFISSLPGTTQLELSRPKKKFKAKEFKYGLVDLPKWVVEDLLNKYELTEEELNEQGFKYVPKQDRLYSPLFDRNGQEYGGQTKLYGGGAVGPKTIIYRARETTGLHYVNCKGRRGEAICLVEDVLSAVKVSRYARGVALLGTGLREEQIAELREETDTLILMLDPDMYQKMIGYKKKYSFYFRNFSMIMLSYDPKDTKHSELMRIFNEINNCRK